MTVARRSLQSLTLYRPEKAHNGFTLFTPMTGVPSNAWLIDMQGWFVHRWQLPGWVRYHAELLPNGNLLFALHDPETPVANLAFASGLLVELDWDSNIVWSYREPCMDGHDRAYMKNGNILIQKVVEVPKDMAAKVKGGVSGTEIDGVMWGYTLQEITHEGKVVWEWLSHDHLDPELDSIHPEVYRHQWPGWNSLEELPDGNIMACSWGTCNIYIIEKATGDIRWRWGRGKISFPHNPTMLDNGNILVFDNGRYNVNFWPPDYSRVIEINPTTNEIEWEYKAQNPVDFHSTYISGCQRLPNGNTLICEGAMGRFFEVTPSSEMVWEYVVPFYAHGPTGSSFGLSNVTFRCLRYGPDYPGLQGKKLDAEKLELWNRLYGPEAFRPWAEPTQRGIEKAPIGEESVLMEKEVLQAKYEEPRPSVEQLNKERKMSSRASLLGY